MGVESSSSGSLLIARGDGAETVSWGWEAVTGEMGVPVASAMAATVTRNGTEETDSVYQELEVHNKRSERMIVIELGHERMCRCKETI